MGIINEQEGVELLRVMLSCAVYRLGGEVKFTPEEINDIKKVCGGVQILLTQDDSILIRAKTHEGVKALGDNIEKI